MTHFRRRGEVTLGVLFETYVEKHVRSHCKNPVKAEQEARWLFNKHLARWQVRRLNAIRPEDVADLHRQIGKSHRRTANVVIRTIRVLYNFALRERLWRGENPARGAVTFYAEARRTRFLQPHELPALFAALKRAPNPDLRDAVALLLWTGARRSDVFGMRWSDLQLDASRWLIPSPKNRKPYTVPLTNEAIEILKDRRRHRRDGSQWIFPGTGRSGHIADLKKAWRKLLVDAGLAYDQPELQIRVHDLRRTLGSWLAMQGTSLPIIGAALGHTSAAATSIYAGVNVDTARQAVSAATKKMMVAAASRKQLPAPKQKRLKAARP